MGESLQSIANVMTTDPRDWSIDRRDAWLYGIVVGWGDALPEVANRHNWDEKTIERLQRLHSEYETLSEATNEPT
jgi:hypothetical protein